MRYAWVAALALGGLAGCAWFDGDDEARRDREVYRDTAGGYQDSGYPLTDPVTGDRVEGDTPHRFAYGGRMYYFGSEDSMAKFRENPSDYVDNEGRIPASRRADWERERARDVR